MEAGSELVRKIWRPTRRTLLSFKEDPGTLWIVCLRGPD